MIRLRFLSALIILSLGISNLVNGQYDSPNSGGNNGDTPGNDDTSSTTSAPSTTTTSAPGGSSTSELTGDSQCPGSRLMCVTATVNGTTVTYDLQSQDNRMGWMAIGFGNQMAGTPMVIMWLNADNTVTMSQRQADGEVMPTPVASPARVATAVTPSASALNGALSKLTFTTDSSYTSQSYIWAFGTVKPSANSDSTLQQHLDSGTFSLDLSKTLPANSSSPSSNTPSSGSISIPLLPYEKMIIAHASVVTFGFLFLLPMGALVARYIRTYSSTWFTGHWLLQGALGGIFVVVGCILGFVATNQQHGGKHSRHKSLGVVLLCLYLLQAFLGGFIHFVKITFGWRRPPQNYAHAVLGLTIIALALYQVRLGYSQEWPTTTGRPVPKCLDIIWMVWVILLPVLYFGGLAYLPRQLRQEKGYRSHHIKLERTYSA